MATKGKALLIQLLLFLLILPTMLRGETPGWVDSTLNRLSLDQQIGQLFMLAAYSNKDADYEKSLEENINKYHIGGLIFFQGTPEKQIAMTNRYQSQQEIPLMIGMDAESGIGWRLKTALHFPDQTLLGAIRDDSVIYRVGQTIGKHCRIMGVHVNFAPVADVNNNPKNPVIGTRSFGEDIDNVGRKSIAYMQGLESQQVMAVAKHFPGHGDTDTDSHHSLPLIRHSMARIDSVELAPFKALFNAGVPGVLMGHLALSAYDIGKLPASLSPRIVTQLLREEMHFDGLCFTDAMNMKGVTQGRKKGEADLLALKAGNDIVLFPEDIAASVREIKRALKEGEISEALIRERCRKVLEAKAKYVLPFAATIDTVDLIERLNAPEDLALKQECYARAVTLIRNNRLLVPLTALDTLRIASVNFGDRPAEVFENTLRRYTDCRHFKAAKNTDAAQLDSLVKKMATYNCVIIYNSASRNASRSNFGSSTTLANLIRKLQGKQIILCHPGTPYGAELYSHLPMDALLIGYSQDETAQYFMAQAIFGGIAIDGRLPVRVNMTYPAGTGFSAPKIRLGYHMPELSGMDSKMLQKIDSICRRAIQLKATPGCEVLVAKSGYVVYHKAFGHHTYKKHKANQTDDIYDVASLTKVAATLPALMQLYDRGEIRLEESVENYLSELQSTNKKGITLRELLLHTGGLKPSISFLQHAIDREKLEGQLFTRKKTTTNTLKISDNLYINPNFKYRDSTFCFEKTEGYRLVSPHFYIHENFRDTVREMLCGCDLLPHKNYTYSDVGFILLKEIFERVSGSPLDQYLKKNFYNSLGARDTDFLAHRTLDMERVVPSSHDHVYRKAPLHGYVHDPTAALLGGIAGHAGLFSTTGDLAKIMAMYLNHGSYGGKHYIDSTTIALFTARQMPIEKNRRGLGFDKPDTRPGKISPVSEQASPSSYGHTGFTGTIAWNDPEHEMTYIFLSNRTYPDEFNKKLTQENIRTGILDVIYHAIVNKMQ